MTAKLISRPANIVRSSASKSESTSGSKLSLVELFAGAGGLAQGFLQTGHYDLIALTDIDTVAKQTFELNYPNPETEYICDDIKNLGRPSRLLKKANGRKVSGLLGGPPCQGFSLAGLRRPDDERNQYIGDYVRFVTALKPDFLLMENVPQVIFHPQFKALIKALNKDFEVQFTVLNAAQYGIAQTRHRAFVLAFRRELGVKPAFPAPTHAFTRQVVFNYRQQRLENSRCKSADKDGIFGADSSVVRAIKEIKANYRGLGEVKPLVNVWDAIGDLVNRSASSAPNHVPRVHKGKLLELIERIPEGGGLENIDSKYHPKSHYSQAYGRLHRHGLARTITTCFQNAGSGRFIHPIEPRTLTIREAARLQGFSDEFVFYGTLGDQMRLVGNAVPPLLAQVIADRIWQDLSTVL
ncbi:DNA cytosine methyltransferase [Coleofasciculus sp. FACHB-T130]|uniref:DNA cytosine methyltransferase n=1 Tax=Cyanophyceae TaxID=3028117 RepID=UPI001688DC4A|nr:DNA cytosine methyltransferase [Coleofasciculus sp. FACHB-T130]MBD1878354.1 DNA cytosine methyltransferase [Coleofasciculus sp. FACHB-T130]